MIPILINLIFAMASPYIEVEHNGKYLGAFLNEHLGEQRCIEAGPGICLFKHPNGVETIITIPEKDKWIEGIVPIPEKTRIVPETLRIPVPENRNVVFVCRNGARGGSIEPEGHDANDGLSMDSAVRSLKRATDLAKSLGTGADLVMCEGGHWYDERLVIEWSGTEENPVQITYYVNLNGVPVWGDPSQLCGAEFGRWKEPECPEELL